MTPLPLLVLEVGSGTKFLTISANPTLWTLFGSHKELGVRQLNSHPAHLNQVLDTPDVQVQKPLVVVKKRGRV
jgi:hypothetical protein